MAAENIHNRVNDKNPNLETVVARTMWPTPQASDNRDRGCMEDPSIKRRIKMGKQIGLTTAVKETRSSGSLNPQWVEWLMGYPEGWTDLED
jgi:DNA (cytosine-5)-methyltransferase 1